MFNVEIQGMMAKQLSQIDAKLGAVSVLLPVRCNVRNYEIQVFKITFITGVLKSWIHAQREIPW